jgi:hypothetical protein
MAFEHAGLAVKSGLAPNTVYKAVVFGTATPAGIYSNATRTTTLSSSVATDANGNASFYSDPGTVSLLRLGGTINEAPIPVNVPVNTLDIEAGSSAPVFQAPTTPPVSGTAYQNTTDVEWSCALTVTLTPTSGAAASVVVALSLDGVAYTTWADVSRPLGSQVLDGETDVITFPVPAGWHYKATATDATLGALIAIG